MRTVLIGSDFVYKSDGNLIPIEINTNTGFDNENSRVEEGDDSFNLSSLLQFITDNGFTKIEYIGAMHPFYQRLKEAVNIECNMNYVANAITIPSIEDNDTTLIIRSAYDTTALVDDKYCANKVNFLNLIKDSSFKSEFAYLDESNNLVNSITTILDNGTHPNFILKAVGPHYDKAVYPKLFKVNTQEQLTSILAEVNSDYFLMPYYFNENKLENNHIQIVRSLNLVVPPNLESIQIGQYHKICNEEINNSSTYDNETFELIDNRSRYLTAVTDKWTPKLEDTDLVEMADGTFKTALDLEIGDELKTIDIPNPFLADNTEETVNYRISYLDLVSGTTFSTNKILNKFRINRKTYIINITFTDDSTWSDVGDSNYLIERNDEVRFLSTIHLERNDYMLLIDSSNGEFIKKQISNVTKTSQYLNGWSLTVERTHLFLTKNSADTTSSYVAIEHNTVGYGCSCDTWQYYTCNQCNGGCGKGEKCDQYGSTSYGYTGIGYCNYC
jgi:hypothetical protein